MRRLLARLCRFMAESHGDAAWSPCGCRESCQGNRNLHPSDCRQRDIWCADHIRKRNIWYARFDRLNAPTNGRDNRSPHE